MKTRLLLAMLVGSVIAACGAQRLLPPGASAVAPLSWSAVASREQPPAGLRLSYGAAPQQFGELRLPPGTGPFPVVVLIHGGCWLQAFDYRYFNHLAAALASEGYATWTPEYRRIGDAGGGWPNTLLDAAAATDHLRTLATDYPLDLRRIAAVGHSAGGQLALWLAARDQLPRDSALYRDDPLPLQGVIGLAAITDLATYRIGPADSCHSAVDRLLDATPDSEPQRYAQTSPTALLPLGVPQWLLQGGRDPIVSSESVRAYIAAATQAGDTVTMRLDADAGHFEPALPDARLGRDLREALQALLLH